MYPAKRQRIEAAAATLSKPFRSPLKPSINTSECCQSSEGDDAQKQTPSGALQKMAPLKVAKLKEGSSEVEKTALSISNSHATDDFIVLQKRYSSLTQELRKLKQDLDVTEQALKIQCSSQNDELQTLILNWRDIARDATDDVFTTTQKRINNMGGVKAWQENALHSSQQWYDSSRSGYWPKPDEIGNTPCTEADLSECDNHYRAGEGQIDDEEQDQTLSVGMILRNLNIDPELLDYDEEAQCWKS